MTVRRLPWPDVAAIALVAVSAVPRFHDLAVPSLWNDEAFSFFVAADGISNMVFWITNDTHPPLYYLALVGWLKLGHGVFALRALSPVAATIAGGFVYLAARALFGWRIALAALALFTVSPHVLFWSQKARPYAFQTMWASVAFWGLALVVTMPAARGRLVGAGMVAAIRERSAKEAQVDVAWAAIAVGGAFAMLSQYPAGFFLLGCNAMMAVVIFRDLRRNRVLLVNWIIAQLVLIGILLTWLPEFLQQASANLTAGAIAEKHPNFEIDTGGLMQAVTDVLSVSHLWRAQIVAVLAYAIILALALDRFIRSRTGHGAVVLVVLVPVAVCVAGYFLLNPVFGYVIMTFDWLQVPYVAIIAAGIAALPSRVFSAVALMFVMALNLWGVKNVLEERPPPLDRIAATIAAGFEPGDGIIFSTTGATHSAIGYYLAAIPAPLAGMDVSRDGRGLIRTASDAARNKRNWVVLPRGETSAVDLAELGRDEPLALTRTEGNVMLLRFDRLK